MNAGAPYDKMASVGGKQMKLFRRIRYNAPFTITFVLISFIALLVNGRTNGAANRLLFSV